jgi:serine/threonine protein kinase
MKGTLGFLAPEQYELHNPNQVSNHLSNQISNPQVFGAADIWALGETAFRLLTKEACFGSVGKMMLYTNGQSEWPDTCLRKRNISDDGIDFIRSLMTAHPERRLTTKQALAHTWILSYLECRDDSGSLSIGVDDLIEYGR